MQDNRAIEALQTQGTWSSKSISSLPDDFLIDAISPSIPINQGSLELSVTEAIEDFGGNTYILGQYREKNESDDIFLPPMQDMQWDGYFVSKLDSNGDSLYVNIENNENQYNSGWGQISLGDEGSLRFITTIDNSGGMPSQDREDVGYQGITADSNRAGFITSFDASGSREWTTLVTGDDIYSYAQSMVTDKDGNSYIYYGDSSWWMPKHLSKVDSDGNIAWNQENIFDVELNSKGASYKPYGGVVAVDGESNPIIAADVGASADVDISLWIADKSTGEIGNSIGTATTVGEKWWTWEIDASDVPNGIFDSSLFDFAGTSEVPSPEPVALIQGDSFYTLVNGPNWQQAQVNARSIGGDLVTINNQEENIWLLRI